MRNDGIGLASFAVTVVLATAQRWDAADLAWSMWAASLVGGYAMILILSLRPHVLHKGVGPRIVTVVMFSAHFLFFHFVHARVLDTILPLEEKGMAFADLLRACLQKFWPFLLIALIRILPALAAGWRSPQGLRPAAPYRAVALNHLAILATIAASHFFGTSPLLYVVLVIYFLPIGAARRLLARNRT